MAFFGNPKRFNILGNILFNLAQLFIVDNRLTLFYKEINLKSDE